ncbi:MAG: hypothetical protein PUF50_00935 [Erysipelotrichaceae bacterium]|nr:hypothetical protein [Erysipelotrichaceae bacterium]
MKRETIDRLLILVLMVLVGFGFWYYMDQKPRMPIGASDSFSKYDHYLKRVQGDAETIEVYIEPNTRFENYTHTITVVNLTEQFYCGTLKVFDINGEVCYQNRIINLRPKEERMIAVNLSTLPLIYQWEDPLFYRFDYPVAVVDASVSYDGYDEYYWMNVIVADDVTVEQCLEYAKMIYIEDILAGMDSLDLIFYKRSEVRYEKGNEQSYPVLDTGCYGAILSQKDKTITIVDWKQEKEQILLQCEMK